MSEQLVGGASAPHRPSRSPYAFATVLVGLLVVVAWTGRGRFRPVIEGERAPAFVAQTLDGREVSLADYRGKVVLVNIWATWCAPCRTEMPSMQALYDRIGSDDFEILAVSVDAESGQQDEFGRTGASAAALAEFASTHGLTFQILRDPEGLIERSYQTSGVPESFLVGRDGVIYRRVPGATVWDHERFRDLIGELLRS